MFITTNLMTTGVCSLTNVTVVTLRKELKWPRELEPIRISSGLWNFDNLMRCCSLKFHDRRIGFLAWHYMMCLPRKLIRKDSQTTNIHQLGRDFETLTQQMFVRTISWFVLVKWFACHFEESGLLAGLAVYRWVKYYATLILTRLIRFVSLAVDSNMYCWR